MLSKSYKRKFLKKNRFKSKPSFNSKYDMVKIYEDATNSSRLKKISRGWIGRCPFQDHEDSTPSFTIYPEIDRYKCYGCGRSGTSRWFKKEMEDQCGRSFAWGTKANRQAQSRKLI